MPVSRLTALAFLGVILLGTILLMLPVSSRDHRSCGLLTAMFTAVSSTCVTGLSLVDTWTQWSAFGQCVLLCIIEIGGMGFMSIASLFIFGLRQRVGMEQRLIMAAALGRSGGGGAVHFQQRLLGVCLITQGSGALILTLHFLPEFGLARALQLGVFHACSAFCNAGFDIFGFRGPGSSLITFSSDPVVLLVLAAMVIIGHTGFLVWDELLERKPWKRLSVYTRLVLVTNTALLLGGMVLICLAEWSNPGTLGPMSWPEKLLNGFFQSVTARTAGFASIDQASLTEAGKGITDVLMLIGGSSGSTAGGLKTVTFVIILLYLHSRLHGCNQVAVFKRSINHSQIENAMTLCGMMVLLSFIGALVITGTTPGVSLGDALYEAISAIATVGVTCGVTPGLSVAAKLMLMLYMYFGRVGLLTLSLGFLQGNPAAQGYSYAETELLIG